MGYSSKELEDNVAIDIVNGGGTRVNLNSIKVLNLQSMIPGDDAGVLPEISPYIRKPGMFIDTEIRLGYYGSPYEITAQLMYEPVMPDAPYTIEDIQTLSELIYNGEGSFTVGNIDFTRNKSNDARPLNDIYVNLMHINHNDIAKVIELKMNGELESDKGFDKALVGIIKKALKDELFKHVMLRVGVRLADPGETERLLIAKASKVDVGIRHLSGYKITTVFPLADEVSFDNPPGFETVVCMSVDYSDGYAFELEVKYTADYPVGTKLPKTGRAIRKFVDKSNLKAEIIRIDNRMSSRFAPKSEADKNLVRENVFSKMDLFVAKWILTLALNGNTGFYGDNIVKISEISETKVKNIIKKALVKSKNYETIGLA